MATKPFVPDNPDTRPVDEEMPAPAAWYADRPGETVGDPRATFFGAVGPDLGYVGTLLPQFADALVPGAADRGDVTAAGAAVARTRAASFGRAPVRQDLEVAFLLLGVLEDTPGDWTSAGQVVAAAVEGCRHDAARAVHVATSLPTDWLRLSADALRARLVAEGPDAIFVDFTH